MQKVSQSNIYKQYLGTRPLLRVYKGEDIIQNYEQDYTQPVDWFDIRTDCPKNSIALYVAHPEDYSSYDNLGFTANCSGGYKVYIDGVQYGSTYTSGSKCSIVWSSANITTGRSILTPTNLIAHKVWVVPATAGNNITAFKCDRVAASGTEYQGVLWAHFNIDNAINLNKAFGSISPADHLNQIMMSCTAKNNILRVITNIQQCFRYCQSLEYIPVIQGNNASLGCNYAFSNCYKLKNITIKNIKPSYATCILQNCRAVKKVIFDNCDFSALTSVAEFISQAAQLTNLSLDFSNSNSMTAISCIGTSEYFMGGFKGLRVSNEAPFDNNTSPKVNVSYTGMDRAALVQLFNDLPYNVGYTTVGSPTINNGVLSDTSGSNFLSITPSTLKYDSNSNIEFYSRFQFDENLTGITPSFSMLYSNVYHNRILSVAKSGNLIYPSSQPVYGSGAAVEFYSYNMQPNTWYRQKLVGNNGTWTMTLYDDNGNVIGSASKDFTFSEVEATFFVGGVHVTGTSTLSKIDLNNTYIKVNGITWFRGQPAMTKTINCSYCTGTGALTNEDKAIVSNKNWNLTADVAPTSTLTFYVPQGSNVNVNGSDYTPTYVNNQWSVVVTLNTDSAYSYTVSKTGYLSDSGSGILDGNIAITLVAVTGTGASFNFNNTGYDKILVEPGTEVSYAASQSGYISYYGSQVIYEDTELKMAHLIVNIDPTPDTVTINGISGDKLLFLDNTTFNYTVVANKTGYQTLTLTGTIDTDATITSTIEKAPLFESSTPGTYSLTLSEPVNCFVAVVGGGSGGGAELFSGNKGGGSGAAVYGNTTLPAGTYTIYVGDGSPKHRDSIVAAGTSSIQENNSAYTIIASGAQSHWSITAGLRGDLVYASDTNLTILQGNDANDMTGGASVYEGYGKGGSYNEDGGSGYVLIRSL